MSKPKQEYQTDEYLELDLPVAPAVMVGDEIVVAGSDVPEDRLEATICTHLGLPTPDPRKKGLLGRFFRKETTGGFNRSEFILNNWEQLNYTWEPKFPDVFLTS